MTPDLPTLDPEELRRYSRHLLLPEVGEEGQRRLKGSRLLLVGAGGLGSPAALYLAAAGVGHITVVAPDAVDVTNLQRQVLHGTRDVGRPKAESARDRLRDLNPQFEEAGPFSHGLAAVRLDDQPDDVQPEACSPHVLAITGNPVEHLEDIFELFVVKPSSPVLYGEFEISASPDKDNRYLGIIR